MKIWDKSLDESPPAWESFQLYRNLGPERSIAKTAEEVGKDISLLERWSSKHKWVLRANAFDAHADQEIQRLQIKERVDMTKRHARMSMLGQQKLVERLNEMAPEDISSSDIPRWLDIVVKVERLSRGVSADTAIDYGPEAPDLDLSGLNDEELERLDELMNKARSGNFT
jgi:hypothetical protein